MKANNIFFYGWLVLPYFKLYGSLVFEKNLNTWVVGLSENQLLMLDRYIK